MATRTQPRTMLACALALAVAGVVPSTGPAAAQGRPACVEESEPNDRPEEAPSRVGELCQPGALEHQADQDLILWEVAPEDGLTAWSFTMRGVPTTITSVHVLPVTSPDGTFPLEVASEVLRVDSDAHLDTPPGAAEIQLAPGPYLLGISRGPPGFGQELTSDLTYEMGITRSGLPPPSGDQEPNDDPSLASPVAGAFAVSGDLAGTTDYYRWTLSEADAAFSWRLGSGTSIGAPLTMTLASQSETLAVVDAGKDGVADIHDLRLPAGDYTIALSSAAAGAQPYALAAVEVTEPDIDPEPNDVPTRAVPMDPATLTARGRLSSDTDIDRHSFEVDGAMAVGLVDLDVSWTDGSTRQLCLQTDTGTDIKCHSGTAGASLAGFLLPAADYILAISGAGGLHDRYEVRVTRGLSPAPDREAEPNDVPAAATPWDPTVLMHGVSVDGDTDTYRVHIDGEPELWQLDATGAGVHFLVLYRPDGTAVDAARFASDGSGAAIDDLYLVRGDHLVSIQAAGAYELRLTSRGPVGIGSEREPNDGASQAALLPVGETKRGRLTTDVDVDVYRFTLAARSHVVLHLDPPSDGAIKMRLETGLEPIWLGDGAPGQAMDYDLELVPGDYLVSLRPETTSMGTYTLTRELADPFRLAVDQEPNDFPNDARPLLPSLAASGTAKAPGDDDWYLVPPLAAPGSLRIRPQGERVAIHLSDGSRLIDLTVQDDGITLLAEGLPAGVPHFLDVTTWGDYTVTVSSDGLAARPDPVDPAIDLALTSSTGTVAAYWPDGQRVEASLTVRSTAATEQDLSLDAVTGHHAWTVRLDTNHLTVPGGGSVTVPVTIDVPPDAWSDEPVRVTVRARDDDGGQQTTFAEVALDPDVAPVAPWQAWSVPDALLGGLNVASLALGAVPGGTYSPVYEPSLYDGITPDGAGFSVQVGALPFVIDVDLAGDVPVPVAGTIIYPQAVHWSLSELPRGFDLLLSGDGEQWQVALSGTLAPLAIEQAFVLASPVDARFARLRVTSMYGSRPGSLSLGEWKVVATPGSVPFTAPLDIADPALGGHVVSMVPLPGDPAVRYRLLDADPRRETAMIEEGDVASFIIGFQDDRAGLITELGWADPEGSDPTTRLDSVEVALSLDSPLGPWQTAGTWTLTRGPDGSVAPFGLPPTTWARYVRLTGAIPKDANDLELPATVRVVERTADSQYRSVFGEWGYTSPIGPYEWLTPPAEVVVDEGRDAGDRARVCHPAVRRGDRRRSGPHRRRRGLVRRHRASGAQQPVDGRGRPSDRRRPAVPLRQHRGRVPSGLRAGDRRRHALHGSRDCGGGLPPARRAASLLDRVQLRHELQPRTLPPIDHGGLAGVHGGRAPGPRGRHDPALRGGAPARPLERPAG